MTVQQLSTGDLKKVSFDEEVYVVSAGTNMEYEATEMQIVYQSLTTPKTWYSFNLNDHTKKVLKQQEVR